MHRAHPYGLCVVSTWGLVIQWSVWQRMGNLLWKKGVEGGGGLEMVAQMHSWQSIRDRYNKYLVDKPCQPESQEQAAAAQPAVVSCEAQKKLDEQKRKRQERQQRKEANDNRDMFARSGDLNQDGRVTRSEARAAKKRPAAEAADLNNDGRVTRSEAAALKRTRLR